jgi:hypothetical protein
MMRFIRATGKWFLMTMSSTFGGSVDPVLLPLSAVSWASGIAMGGASGM